MRQWVKRYQYVNLIGATADDVRDIMITGESGILAICPKDERPRYIANKRMLAWPNGAISLLFTAEEPDRFRGKQHMKLWLDELAAWRYGQESWDQASLGLRLGDRPQAVHAAGRVGCEGRRHRPCHRRVVGVRRDIAPRDCISTARTRHPAPRGGASWSAAQVSRVLARL